MTQEETMKHGMTSCKAVLSVVPLRKVGVMAVVMALLCSVAWMALVLTTWKVLAEMP